MEGMVGKNKGGGEEMSLIKKSEVWRLVKSNNRRAEKTIYDALDKQVNEIVMLALQVNPKKKTVTADEILAIKISK